MAQREDTGFRTFEADAAIAQHARVLLEADGKVVTAGVADQDVGTAMDEAFASGDLIAVKLRTAAGTHKAIAAGAIAVGASINTAASGKVNDVAAATSYQIGEAISAASADGDIIEIIYSAHGDTAVP